MDEVPFLPGRGLVEDEEGGWGRELRKRSRVAEKIDWRGSNTHADC
jgi:hypothetical protein